MPKVSFILPAYKRRFLHEAIASILAQTYRDFELVVVDDCSPEDLKAVVDEFHDERLSYHRNEKNIGGKDLVAAWNHAMQYARGEWCVLASDDDVYSTRYLATMIRLSEKYPQVDVVHCRIAMINSDGKLICVGRSRGEYESPAEMVYNTAVLRIPLRAPDVMFRLAALQKAGGFYHSPRAWMSDIGTWCLLAMEHGSVCSNEVLFSWRESGENISNVHSDALEKIRAVNLFLPWFAELLKKIVPQNGFDRFFLNKAFSDYQSVTKSISWYVLSKAPLMAWLSVLFSKELSFVDKLRMCKRKLRQYV